MAPLKENLRYHLKKHHMGKATAVTIRDLARELLPIRCNAADIQGAVGEFSLDGIPVVISPNLPRTVYFAKSDEEFEEAMGRPICF